MHVSRAGENPMWRPNQAGKTEIPRLHSSMSEYATPDGWAHCSWDPLGHALAVIPSAVTASCI